jgi:hypothetical protein
VPPAKPRDRKKRKTKPDAASPLVSDHDGTSPERGRESEHGARNGPRTSRGDGVVKPAGSRIEWAQLLRRIYLVESSRTGMGRERETPAASLP